MELRFSIAGPLKAACTTYTVDEANNEWTQNNLKQFLDDFASQSGVQSIFLIAHSMGSRALTRAFGQLIREKPSLRNRFKEIILSAPDSMQKSSKETSPRR